MISIFISLETIFKQVCSGFLGFFVSKKNTFVWEGDTEKSYEMIKDHDGTRLELWKSFHSTSKNKDEKGKRVTNVLSRHYTLMEIEDVYSLGFEAWEEYHWDDVDFVNCFRNVLMVSKGSFWCMILFSAMETNLVFQNMLFEGC